VPEVGERVEVLGRADRLGAVDTGHAKCEAPAWRSHGDQLGSRAERVGVILVDLDVHRLDELGLGNAADALVDERQGYAGLLTILVEPRGVLAEGLVDNEGEELVGERGER